MQVVHVGSSYSPDTASRGLSILFSAPLALGQDWEQLIRVTDARDNPVTRDWLHSRNPRSLYIPSLPSGRYRITMEPRIQDTQGRMLKVILQGSVTIP